jgi:phage shock protein E
MLNCRLLLCLLCLSLPVMADPVDFGTRASLTPVEAVALRDQVVLLDVRSSAEWLMGHASGAIHIPHDEVATRVAALIPDRTTPIVTYCASGGRASLVIAALKAQGYTAVPVTPGGYKQLLEAGINAD